VASFSSPDRCVGDLIIIVVVHWCLGRDSKRLGTVMAEGGQGWEIGKDIPLGRNLWSVLISASSEAQLRRILYRDADHAVLL